MKLSQLSILFILLFIHSFVQANPLKVGSWMGNLNLQNTHELNFQFEVDPNQKITIKNGGEIVEMKDYQIENDSIKVYFTNFPNYLIFKVDPLNENKLSGYFVNPDRKKHSRIEFKAFFYDDTPVIDNELWLTSFDGAHVFLFTAHLINDTLRGEFLSGNHWKTDWIGVRNDDFTLKDPDSLTYMVKDDFKFQFKNLNGQNYVYPNQQLKGKVVIVQILGTWCPNCLDETKFYNELYDQFHNDGLEIIGVAYESPENFEDQVERIQRYIDNKSVPYPILVGGRGSKTITSS